MSFSITLDYARSPLVEKREINQSHVIFSGYSLLSHGQVIGEDQLIHPGFLVSLNGSIAGYNQVTLELAPPDDSLFFIGGSFGGQVQWSMSVQLWWADGASDDLAENLYGQELYGGNYGTLSKEVVAQLELVNPLSAENSGASNPFDILEEFSLESALQETAEWVQRPGDEKSHAWTDGPNTSLALHLDTRGSDLYVKCSAIRIHLLFPLGLLSSASNLLTMRPDSRVSIKYISPFDEPRTYLPTTQQGLFRVTDVTPPDFGATCPQNYDLILEPGNSSAFMNHTEPVATDRSNVTLTTNVDIDTPLRFTLGPLSHQIVYTATDEAGNEVWRKKKEKRKEKSEE